MLLARDSDSFNRWQALQTLATRLLLRAVAAIRGGGAAAPNPAFIAAYGSVVADALAGRIDPAFAALALTLPSEADLAREMAVNVDPDAIYRAREDLRGALGRAHAAALRGAARGDGRRRRRSRPTRRAPAAARCATRRWRCASPATRSRAARSRSINMPRPTT